MSAFTNPPTQHPTAETDSGTRVTIGPNGKEYFLRRLCVTQNYWSLRTLGGKRFLIPRYQTNGPYNKYWHSFEELTIVDAESLLSPSPFEKLLKSLCKDHITPKISDNFSTMLLSEIQEKLSACQNSDTWYKNKCGFESDAKTTLQGTKTLGELNDKATELFDELCLCEYCAEPNFYGAECDCIICDNCYSVEDSGGSCCECGDYIGDCEFCECRCKESWDNGYLRDGTLYCRTCGKGEPWTYEEPEDWVVDCVMNQYNIWSQLRAWNQDGTKTTQDLEDSVLFENLFEMYPDGIYDNNYCRGETNMLDCNSCTLETAIGEHIRLHLLDVAKEKLASMFMAVVVLKKFSRRYFEYAHAPGGPLYQKARARFEKMSNK